MAQAAARVRLRAEGLTRLSRVSKALATEHGPTGSPSSLWSGVRLRTGTAPLSDGIGVHRRPAYEGGYVILMS